MCGRIQPKVIFIRDCTPKHTFVKEASVRFLRDYSLIPVDYPFPSLFISRVMTSQMVTPVGPESR